MHILVLALALLPAATFAEERDPVRPPVRGSAGPECRNASAQHAKAMGKPARPRNLAQEPAADQYLTVLRLEGGCDKPVKIRESIGDDAGDQR